MLRTEEAVGSRATFPTDRVDEAVHDAKQWLERERAEGTLVGAETLWSEAYHVYLAAYDRLAEVDRAGAWPCIAAALVFDTGNVPLNQRTAAHEACEFLLDSDALPVAEKARRLQAIAETHNVAPWKIRALLAPGLGCPWLFPRTLWSRNIAARAIEAILAPFEWAPGREPDSAWLADNGLDRPLTAFMASLQSRAPEGSALRRAVVAVGSLVAAAEQEQRDIGVIETHAFISELAGHGLSPGEVAEWHGRLLILREAVVQMQAYHLYQRAEQLAQGADQLRELDPDTARRQLSKAANIYKRLAVAQLYPERLLERHQQIVRSMEALTAQHGLSDERSEQVLLISTAESPGDLQRLLLSVSHQLMGFAYGKEVRLVVNDGSTGDARSRNEQIFEEFGRLGMNISAWDSARQAALLARLNQEVFPDGSFDVGDLAGQRKPGEKGVPYGRFRNFLRLAALTEVRERGLETPIFTWLDQDNELGALVLTRDGTLDKRHPFNYFDQKSDIFTDPKIHVAGGGYTNDALEGVEKFWVAWGILHSAFGLAQEHSPQAPAVLSPAADITRFRPWDQPDTLERLPREGEDVETMSDQFLLLLSTLVGTFRGKYDNQVQIYHPWSHGYVAAEDERLVEELRPFAGMPGGNTSFGTDVLASSIPFITVGGRGEDIFHLWQLEGTLGPGSICLTHTPVLHTRNVQAGRGDLMVEIVDSYNGRIFREPPYLWAALRQLFEQGPDAAVPGAAVEAETEARIEALREEAKANIGAVSGFAAEIEPYLDENSEFWWLAQAENDPRCATVLTRLRNLVQEFKDVDRHLEKAEKQLLGLEDVKELTAEFMAAYPHWATVVAQCGGRAHGGARESASSVGTGPRESYGSPLREQAHAAPGYVAPTTMEPPTLGEPVDDPPWQEVFTSSLLLFRRYERGQANQESWLDWADRVERLRSLYEHHASRVAEVPAFAWTMLFRDALFLPRSAPYRAVSQLLSDGVVSLDAAQREEAVARVADELDVDARLIRPAVEVAAS